MSKFDAPKGHQVWLNHLWPSEFVKKKGKMNGWGLSHQRKTKLKNYKYDKWIVEKLDSMDASNWYEIKRDLQREILCDSMTLLERLWLVVRSLDDVRLVMILPMYVEQRSQRYMAKALQCSPSTVNELLKKLKEFEGMPSFNPQGVDPDYAARVYKHNGHMQKVEPSVIPELFQNSPNII